MEGDGNAAYNGPNPVHLDTIQSGNAFFLTDPNITGLTCQDYDTDITFNDTDDHWGNGDATSRETGCVDAMFAAQTEARMLSQWLGRNGMDGQGGAWPIRVGLDDLNAFYDGVELLIGHNGRGQWITSNDVI